jgi:hypothetical protein
LRWFTRLSQLENWYFPGSAKTVSEPLPVAAQLERKAPTMNVLAVRATEIALDGHSAIRSLISGHRSDATLLRLS